MRHPREGGDLVKTIASPEIPAGFFFLYVILFSIFAART